MRHLICSGTPRGLQDRPATVIAPLLLLLSDREQNSGQRRPAVQDPPVHG